MLQIVDNLLYSRYGAAFNGTGTDTDWKFQISRIGKSSSACVAALQRKEKKEEESIIKQNSEVFIIMPNVFWHTGAQPWSQDWSRHSLTEYM
jgi:hypothetical protein